MAVTYTRQTVILSVPAEFTLFNQPAYFLKGNFSKLA